MREIKFRAYDTKFGVMLPNVVAYGNNSVILTDVAFNEAYGDRVDERYESGIEEAGFEHVCITGDLVIEQFTGLKDKNDKEIYEGDIVECVHDEGLSWVKTKHDIGEVIFSDQGMFVIKVLNPQTRNAKDIKKRYFYISFKPNREYTVKGNIHENPELLS